MISLLANLPLPLAQETSYWDSFEWFQPPASTTAENVDWLFWFITWLCIFFFVLIIGLMVWFMWAYRARPGYTHEESPHHNNLLEIGWSVIPLLLVVLIFWWGFTGYIDMRNAPADAYEINVQAQKWNWAFVYPNGHVDTELHVEVGRPVKMVLSSSDVLHSLYIPAFRVKMDCVPGKYTYLWFNPTQASQDDNEDGELEFKNTDDENAEPHGKPPAGGFDLFCTEYCGTGHSNMYAKVIVHETGGFEKWMKKALDPRSQGTPAEVGEKLYARRGCSQCHSIDGTDRPANGGPSFKGYLGKNVAWTNGESGPVDENYIRESILNPNAKVRKGYRPIMPTFQGQLGDDQIFAIIQYIKQINEEEPEDWAPLPEEEGADGEEGEGGASVDGATGDEAAGGEAGEAAESEDAEDEAAADAA